MDTFNFKDIPEPSFEPLPEDRYEVEVVNVQPTTTREGDPMFNIRFTVVNAEDSKYNGRTLWANMSLGEGAISYFKRFLAAVGSDLIEGENVTPDQICTDLVGRHATCLAVPGETPQGKKKNDLRYWQPVSSDINLVQ